MPRIPGFPGARLRTWGHANPSIENRGSIVTDRSVLDRMNDRAKAVRNRAMIRSWKYRQRGLAAGVWFRLRRVLADAKEAYVISANDANQLLSEGYQAESCGAQIEPEKTI